MTPAQNMSKMPTTKVAPKPITTKNTGIPGVGIPGIPGVDNIVPGVGVTREAAQRINAPVNDSQDLNGRINNDDPRTVQLRQHFDHLKGKNELKLNKKQTEYIGRFKAKFPDYNSVPDTILYGKVILADPKTMEKYGNIGERNFIQRLGDATFGSGVDIVNAAMDGVDAYQDYNIKDGGAMNEGVAIASGAGKFVGDAFMNAGANIINLIRPKKDNLEGTTSTSELLGKNTRELPGKVWNKTTGLIDRVKGEGWTEELLGKAGNKAVGLIDWAKGEGWTEKTMESLYEQIQNNPEVRKEFTAAMNILNVLPIGFAGRSTKALNAKQIINQIARDAELTIGKPGIMGTATKEALDAGMNTPLSGSLSTGKANLSEWLKTLPPETAPNLGVAEKSVVNNRKVLEGIRNTQTGEKILSKADGQGFDPIDDLARYEDLRPVIDEDGRIDTSQAIDNLNNFVEPKAKTVRDLIESENRRVSLEMFRKEALEEIKGQRSQIGKYGLWKNYIDKAMDEAKYFSDSNGTIPLEVIDDIKKSMYGISNFLDPDDSAIKAIARAGKNIIEKNTRSADIKALNRELSRWYNTRDYLKSIGVGKVIRGGRMGKYFAKLAGQGAGAIVGGTIGGAAGAFLGGVAGGEIADAIKGKMLSGAFKNTKGALPESQLFNDAETALNKGPALLDGPSGQPTSFPSIYSREAEQLGRESIPGGNNTPNNSNAIPIYDKPPTNVEKLVRNIEGSTAIKPEDIKKFDALSPEDRALALQESPKLQRMEAERDVIDFIGNTTLPGETLSPEAKKMLTPILEAVKNGEYTDRELSNLIKTMPKEAKTDIIKANKERIAKISEDERIAKQIPKTTEEVAQEQVTIDAKEIIRLSVRPTGRGAYDVADNFMRRLENGQLKSMHEVEQIVEEVLKSTDVQSSSAVKKVQDGYDKLINKTLPENGYTINAEGNIVRETPKVVAEVQTTPEVAKEAPKPVEKVDDYTRATQIHREPPFARSDADQALLDEHSAQILLEEKQARMPKIMKEFDESGQEDFTAFVKSKMSEVTKNEEAMSVIEDEFMNSEAGSRWVGTDSMGFTIAGRTASTFPQWIPEKLRRMGLMQDTLDFIRRGEIIPTKNTAMRELADEVYNRISNYKFYETETSAKLGKITSPRKGSVDPEVKAGTSSRDGVSEITPTVKPELSAERTKKSKRALGEEGHAFMQDFLSDRKATPTKNTLPMAEKQAVKYSTPDKLSTEAKKYKSAEEFIKSQGEPVYHGTNARKIVNHDAVKQKYDDILVKLTGKKYSGKTLQNDIEYFIQNKDRIINKKIVANEIDELIKINSSRLEKPSVDFAGASSKDSPDNVLGAFFAKDKDFAGRFTYDISINPYTGKMTRTEGKNPQILENYIYGNSVNLYKMSGADIQKISKIVPKIRGKTIAELTKTKEGSKEIQKGLASKRGQLLSEGIDSIKNFAYNDVAKKYQLEIVALSDDVIKTKSQLTDIWNKANKKASLPMAEKQGVKYSNPVDALQSEKYGKTLRGTKGLTADDIMQTYPNIRLTKDVQATDIYGNKVVIPDGEKLTPYELKGNKILLQDGQTYIVSKNQFQNIKGNTVGGEPKPFAPELVGMEETVKGETMMKEKAKAKADFEAGKITREEYNSSTYKGGDTSKYSSYQLPDGKNYKEVLIRAPENIATELPKGAKLTKYTNENGEIEYGVVEQGGAISATGKTAQEVISKYNKKNNPLQNFNSSHWEEKNVIAHLRLNERTYKGKQVTFMEELQSDWAREGRNKGFTRNYTKEDITSLPDTDNFWKFKVPDNELQISKAEYPTKELAIQRVLSKTTGGGSVPNNPLLKKWQETSIKRALREAVDNGSEYFAWINGEQTSARYNLAKSIDDVKWEVEGGTKTIRLMPTGQSGIKVFTDEKGIVTGGGQNIPAEWKGKKLDEVLGKGLADKIMEKDTGKLSGDGLKFGGEWANTLYDKQVGNIVKDLTGAKVEMMDMGLPIDKKFEPWQMSNGKYTLGENLTTKNMKVGMEIGQHAKEGFIITDVLGDGKFKATTKAQWEKYNYQVDFKTARERLYSIRPDTVESFDISVKTTTQQGIQITPEIRSKILGEALEIKTSGIKFE